MGFDVLKLTISEYDRLEKSEKYSLVSKVREVYLKYIDGWKINEIDIDKRIGTMETFAKFVKSFHSLTKVSNN